MTIGSFPPRISPALAGVLPWAVIAILGFTMAQRRFMDVGIGKRFATLQLGGLVALLWAATLVFEHFGSPDIFLLPVCLLLGLIAVLRRRSIFLYRLRCSSCGAALPLQRILFYDEPRCEACVKHQSETEAGS